MKGFTIQLYQVIKNNDAFYCEHDGAKTFCALQFATATAGS